ncbi:MAG TPA: GNAT family N-acetyltransferase [Kineosporiaceae bacterium]|nr:GNAT family N-acetyltransferase [Kineosporiaceae bacterium]
MTVELLTPDRAEDVIPGLAELLADAVAGGAGVGFLAGLTVDDAAAWWRRALADPAALTWVALDADGAGVDGVVRLHPAPQQNGPHRAEVSKLLVHRRARGRGVAAALLGALEQEALARGRWLLVLDTTTGSTADRLYRRLGWQPTGEVPDYALDVAGAPSPTTVFWKDLRP